MILSASGQSVGWLLAATGLAGGAVWLAWPPPVPARSRLGSLPRVTPAAGSPALAARLSALAPELTILVAGALAAVLTAHLVLLLVGPLLAAAVRRERRRRALRRETDARRAAVRQFCMSLSAELRVGRAPPDAAERAAVPLGATAGGTGLVDLVGIGRAVASGVDPAGVLRTVAQAPGAEALRRVATCWEVAAYRGAGLADAIDRLVEGLLHEESQRQEVAAQLAGARATARLLALLPAFGLLLGSGLGADPVHVLLGTSYGMACLLLGIMLNVGGLVWTERLARTAEGRP